jgi:hypothetical protein
MCAALGYVGDRLQGNVALPPRAICCLHLLIGLLGMRITWGGTTLGDDVRFDCGPRHCSHHHSHPFLSPFATVYGTPASAPPRTGPSKLSGMRNSLGAADDCVRRLRPVLTFCFSPPASFGPLPPQHPNPRHLGKAPRSSTSLAHPRLDCWSSRCPLVSPSSSS